MTTEKSNHLEALTDEKEEEEKRDTETNKDGTIPLLKSVIKIFNQKYCSVLEE